MRAFIIKLAYKFTHDKQGTGSEKRNKASLSSLKTSLQGIEARMDECCDERLIEWKRTEGSRGRAGEVAHKSFRVRAGADTAGISTAASDRSRAAKALDKVAKKAESDGGGKKREVSGDRIEHAKR